MAEHAAPKHVTEALDASVRDLESDTVADAGSAQIEARRLLAEYERSETARARKPVKSA